MLPAFGVYSEVRALENLLKCKELPGSLCFKPYRPFFFFCWRYAQKLLHNSDPTTKSPKPTTTIVSERFSKMGFAGFLQVLIHAMDLGGSKLSGSSSSSTFQELNWF